MRVSNPPAPRRLPAPLVERLQEIRATRGFDAAIYAEEKARMLNRYMGDHGLAACVVAVSGGIDSAVVLGLVVKASGLEGSPIRRIVPVLAPVHDPDAATGQLQATARGEEIVASLSLSGFVVDLTAAHATVKDAVDQALCTRGEGWASGQLASYVRTPAFYYLTSLLLQENLPAILVGTTNRDEGAYLGYVGKASDGMVDVQVIADLHKSEVMTLARHLQLPASVIELAPRGDMYDGRLDEEVFGAPYDFVEIYLDYLCRPREAQVAWLSSLPADARKEFDELAGRLERLHSHNLHKYLGRSPAVHLNLLPSAVPGGWDK